MPQPPFLSAEWKNLIMLNYEVDPNVLQPYLPSGTELDSFHEKHYCSMVGFLFLKTRVLGLPIPFHQNFEEVNLRFYVRRKYQNEWRRGVVFVREIVPRWAITFVANKLFNENYLALPMRHSSLDCSNSQGQTALKYEWKFNQSWNSISATYSGVAREMLNDSLEEFIAEHYWGYAKGLNKSTEYRVEHPRWKVLDIESCKLDCDVNALYGDKFAQFISGEPSSAFVAEGSAVKVYWGKRF